MSHGRQAGFVWGVNFGAGIVLAFALHWAFAAMAICAAYGVYYFRDTDAPLFSSRDRG